MLEGSFVIKKEPAACIHADPGFFVWRGVTLRFHSPDWSTKEIRKERRCDNRVPAHRSSL